MIAEVPEAIAVWANPLNYRLRPQAQENGPYSLIVIHITSGRADPYGPARMWQEPLTPPSSAHFVVGQKGELLQCVPLKFAAYHAHRANSYSIGVEHCVREPGELGKTDPGMPPTTELYATSARLVAYLLKAAGLAVVHGRTIKGHAEADPLTTHTGCPNAGPWHWEHYLRLVEAAYAAIIIPKP